jgi:hypothetical protein
MRPLLLLAGAVLAFTISPVLAQDANAPALGEVVVTGNRLAAPYADRERPVVGLRRRADSAVMRVTLSSDSRDEADRKREIHTMLAAALQRAPAAGIEVVIGSFSLLPVTQANYQDLPMVSAGRIDTSQVEVMVKVRLTGTATAAGRQLDAFIAAIPRTGRGVMEASGQVTLTIVDPDQYRDQIVRLVAENARKYSEMFGADYAVQVTGIDRQIVWSQVSPTEVFLYVPYSYTVVPR